MDTHLHSQPAHTALNWGLMQRWKQSRGAANTAAHFKSIPFPGHQLQQQHRKPSLILPLLSSSLMVFMHGRTPPARRPTAPRPRPAWTGSIQRVRKRIRALNQCKEHLPPEVQVLGELQAGVDELLDLAVNLGHELREGELLREGLLQNTGENSRGREGIFPLSPAVCSRQAKEFWDLSWIT